MRATVIKNMSFAFFTAIMCVSCMVSAETSTNVIAPGAPSLSKSILVSESNLPLFADLTGYNLSLTPFTKSGGGHDVQHELSSLIDSSRCNTLKLDGVTYREYPFYQNEEQLYVLFHDSQNTQNSISDSCFCVKKFLVHVDYDSRDKRSQEYVATMLTSPSYKGYSGGEYGFLYKGNYTGLILFSSLEGRLKNAYWYENGRLFKAVILKKDETSYSNVHYVSVFVPGSDMGQTKSPDELTPSYCIAYMSNITPSTCYAYLNGQGGTGGSGSNNNNSNAGNSGLNNNEQSAPPGEEEEDQPYFTVDLTTNKPDTVTMRGSGLYNYGALVCIEPDYVTAESDVVDVSQILLFSNWIGDLKNEETAWVDLTVEADVFSTAMFGILPPCRNKMTGKANPTREMRVAASNGSGNYLGGTYGYTRYLRDGSLKKHNGLDIAADLGTPVFSMYDGVITKVVSDFPDTYVRDSFGNEVRIQSVINGVIVEVQYAHLMPGQSGCINPRTQIPFSLGDHVYQGDLIGYSGRTGNACNVPNPHVHIGVLTSDGWINPADYINGVINTREINGNQGQITNIVCN